MGFITDKAIIIELDASIHANKARFRDIKHINQLWHKGKYDSYLDMFKVILNKVVKPANYGYDDSHKRQSFTFHTMLLVAENYAMRIREGVLAEALHEKDENIVPEYQDIDYSNWFLNS